MKLNMLFIGGRKKILLTRNKFTFHMRFNEKVKFKGTYTFRRNYPKNNNKKCCGVRVNKLYDGTTIWFQFFMW